MNIADEMFENLGFKKHISSKWYGDENMIWISYIKEDDIIKKQIDFNLYDKNVEFIGFNKELLCKCNVIIESNEFRAIAQKFKELEEQKWKEMEGIKWIGNVKR